MQRVYSGYGGGMPQFTVSGGQIHAGYGGGMPVLTGEGCGLMSLAAAAVLS